MKILHHISDLASCGQPQHLALGVFDGVHVGHQAVIQQAVDAAKQDGGVVGVVTFEPHPIRVLAPEMAPRRILASVEHKAKLLEAMGVDFLCVQEFNEKFALREARDFISDLVNYSGGVRSISVGEDWVFGHKRGGDLEKLRLWGELMGFAVNAMPAVRVDQQRVSSTRVRQAVQAGDLELVEKLLGRPYEVVGTVIEGRKLARTLGFPTANLVVHNEQLPPDGVWELRVKIAGREYSGIGNLGRRPTVEHEGARRLLEVHVFDFDGNLYGSTMEVTFVRFIRPEKKFSSIEELKRQIAIDVESVRHHNG